MIIWSKPATEDLRLIHQYIAHDSKHYATRVIQDITNKVENLMSLPRLGRAVTRDRGAERPGNCHVLLPYHV